MRNKRRLVHVLLLCVQLGTYGIISNSIHIVIGKGGSSSASRSPSRRIFRDKPPPKCTDSHTTHTNLGTSRLTRDLCRSASRSATEQARYLIDVTAMQRVAKQSTPMSTQRGGELKETSTPGSELGFDGAEAKFHRENYLHFYKSFVSLCRGGIRASCPPCLPLHRGVFDSCILPGWGISLCPPDFFSCKLASLRTESLL
jgi:hypothetical protein